MSRHRWTIADLDLAAEALSRSETVAEAAQVVSGALGKRITADALRRALERARERGHPYQVDKNDIKSPEVPTCLSTEAPCEELPASLRARPAVGETSVFLLWADLHVGSDNCDHEAIRRLQDIAVLHGAQHALLAGDWCDGSYTKRGGQHEQTHVGLDKQVDATLDLLDPRLEHWVIDGNHEHTFYVAGGARPGEALEAIARQEGRPEIHFLGYPKAQAMIRGILFELVHYKRGVRRAPIAHLQGRSDRTLPDVLVGGHYHIYDLTHARGVLCIQPGALQCETDFMAGSEIHPLGGVLLHVYHGERGPMYWTTFVDLETAA
jgi:predicted phosphodiesterase